MRDTDDRSVLESFKTPNGIIELATELGRGEHSFELPTKEPSSFRITYYDKYLLVVEPWVYEDFVDCCPYRNPDVFNDCAMKWAADETDDIVTELQRSGYEILYEDLVVIDTDYGTSVVLGLKTDVIRR